MRKKVKKHANLLKRTNRRLWKTLSKYGIESRAHVRPAVFASYSADA